ncbi:MAG: S41 family peptidase [Pseudomonadota bacterium]
MRVDSVGRSVVAATSRNVFAVFFAVVFIAAMLPNRSWAQTSEYFTREEIAADLSEAYEILRRNHPNFTRHKSAQQQQSLYDGLVASIPRYASIDAAYLLLSELVGAVCDEHTQIIKRQSDYAIMPGGWPWFERPLFVRAGSLYIEDDYTRQKEKVVSINGVSGDEIAAKLAARMPNDGCVDDGVLVVSDFLRVSGHIVSALLGTTGPYWIISIGAESGKPKGQTVEAASPFYSRFDAYLFHKERRRDLARELLVNSFTKRYLGHEVAAADLSYRFAERGNLAYVKVDSFLVAEKAKTGIEKVMRDIIERKPDALFIDFTGNPGGYTETAQFFMAFLLPRSHRLHSRAYRKNVSRDLPPSFKFTDQAAKDARNQDIRYFRRIKPRNGIRSTRVGRRSFGKPDYKGKLYVLVSPESRSNAIKVASNLRRLRNATIVGNVTAANTVSVCAAARGSFKLKHTGFLMSVPEICYSSPENRFADDGTLVPDVAVDVFEWPLVNLNSMILRTAVEDHRATSVE